MHLSTRGSLAALCAVLAASAQAQDPWPDAFGKRPLEGAGKLERTGKLERHDESKGASEKSVSKSTSSGGETKSYRRVERDGVVVEEEGTPFDALDSKLRGAGSGDAFDAEAMLEELRRKMGTPALDGAKGETSKSSSSHSRRVVVVNGKTIVDEEFRDGKPVRPGAAGGGGSFGDDGSCRAEARAEAHAESRSDGSSSDRASSDGGSKPAPVLPLPPSKPVEPLKPVDPSKPVDSGKPLRAGDARRSSDASHGGALDPKPARGATLPPVRPSKVPTAPRRLRDA